MSRVAVGDVSDTRCCSTSGSIQLCDCSVAASRGLGLYKTLLHLLSCAHIKASTPISEHAATSSMQNDHPKCTSTCCYTLLVPGSSICTLPLPSNGASPAESGLDGSAYRYLSWIAFRAGHPAAARSHLLAWRAAAATLRTTMDLQMDLQLGIALASERLGQLQATCTYISFTAFGGITVTAFGGITATQYIASIDHYCWKVRTSRMTVLHIAAISFAYLFSYQCNTSHSRISSYRPWQHHSTVACTCRQLEASQYHRPGNYTNSCVGRYLGLQHLGEQTRPE